MTEILGAVMIYSWIHGFIIVKNKIQATTSYENIVLIFSAVAFALFVIGELIK